MAVIAMHIENIHLGMLDGSSGQITREEDSSGTSWMSPHGIQ